MQNSASTSGTLPSSLSIIPSIAAGWLVLCICFAVGFLFPILWQWQLTGFVAIIFMGAVASWISPPNRHWSTFCALAGGLGVLTLIGGSGWFYYSLLFVPIALGFTCSLLAIGYAGGLLLRRIQTNRLAVLAVLGCILMLELGSLFARDGYLLIRYARPRRVAFNDTAPSWFFFSPAERAHGLSYVGFQRAAIDRTGAKRIFAKALSAADQIPNDNHTTLFFIAEAQVNAGFFEDAVATIGHMKDESQLELHLGVVASQIARRGGREQAHQIFDQAIQKARQQQEQYKRDRDLYLIGYRQWEGGMFGEARQTAELIETVESKTDLLDRVNRNAEGE